MKTIYLKKHKIDYDEYLDAADVFEYVSECSTEGGLAYQFAKIVSDWQNYWNYNTPTAFGNPDYNYLAGQFVGYIIAKQYEKEETSDQIIIRKGNRKIWVIDKIEKPESYFEAERDNIKTLNSILR